nr:zf-HC2 domain-containing protein [candidate division Zixibacteria bacterium]
MKNADNCTDPETGRLLHAYELGLLSEEERDRFETHLIGCRFCHDQLVRFAPRGVLLKANDKVAETTRRILQEDHLPAGRRLWKHLWPDRPIILRPLISLIIILLLLWPAYRGLFQNPAEDARPVKEITLIQTRSNQVISFRLKADQNAILAFRYPEGEPGQTHSIRLTKEDSTVIFNSDTFDSFDNFETGRLLLPGGIITPGEYILSVRKSGRPQNSPVRYYFRIEPAGD